MERTATHFVHGRNSSENSCPPGPEEDFPLIVPEVLLGIRGQGMRSPANIVYSTGPIEARDTENHHYCVKGEGDARIVLAEVIGHILAGFLSVSVPSYAVGRFEARSEPLFCSEIIEGCMRDVGYWLKKRKATNLEMLQRLIVLDVWLANNDRNMGNLLGRSVDRESDDIEMVAIDFEKSLTVRLLSPNIEIADTPEKAFWPRDELGTLCRTIVRFTPDVFDQVRKIPDLRINRAVSAAANATGVKEFDSITHVLLKRRDKIEQLVTQTCK